MGKLSMAVWAFILLIWVACNKEEPTPSYIYIPSFEVHAQPEFGSSSSKISEAWVYANNKLLGVFPMPATVPILESGDTELRIFPGVHDNGILARPTIYPFYEPIITHRELAIGQVDTLPLATQYLSPEEIETIVNIDFDAGNLLNDDLDGDTTTFVTILPQGFEGESGRLLVNDTSTVLSVGNNSLFELPQNGSKIYLEMDYRNDQPFSIWIRGHKTIAEGEVKLLSIINKKEDWNKIYIPLKDFVQQNKWIDYQIIFTLQLTDDQIASGATSAEVLLDNIKVLKYK